MFPPQSFAVLLCSAPCPVIFIKVWPHGCFLRKILTPEVFKLSDFSSNKFCSFCWSPSFLLIFFIFFFNSYFFGILNFLIFFSMTVDIFALRSNFYLFIFFSLPYHLRRCNECNLKCRSLEKYSISENQLFWLQKTFSSSGRKVV